MLIQATASICIIIMWALVVLPFVVILQILYSQGLLVHTSVESTFAGEKLVSQSCTLPKR